MQWHGGGCRATAPLAFIGKGVTFDTGGISIKPAAGMGDMKWDMAGAGVVIGLMRLLAARKAKVNAVGIVGLVENMPSGTAQRPGDIVTSMSGQTIEVMNTDAEGRLVLADALWYCQDRFKPRLMIDLATLTGAIIVALGHDHAGLFANDDELAERLIEAGKAVGEKLWRLPLADSYDREIDSDAADVKNIGGGRAAGSIIARAVSAALRQRRAVGASRHRRTAWSTKDAPTVPKGATALWRPPARPLRRAVLRDGISGGWPKSASTICCRRRWSGPCRGCSSARAREGHRDRRPGRLARARRAPRCAALDL